jgi:tRNA(Met) C34 N-acetyltransferase TmcA
MVCFQVIPVIRLWRHGSICIVAPALTSVLSLLRSIVGVFDFLEYHSSCVPMRSRYIMEQNTDRCIYSTFIACHTMFPDLSTMSE